MESFYQEDEVSAETPMSCRSSESDDSQRLVIAEESEDLGGPQGSGNAQDNTERRRYTYEEYKKICVRDYLLKKLTYYKLKRLMALYHEEISEKSVLYRRRCLTSWKTAKVMSKTLMMFHLMFEEMKENITLNSIYYQRMSDLISIYIDFEIKASEVNAESAGILSSRLTSIMEKCLDHQYRFTLDTLLKSHNICNKFQEISILLISRVVRGLPSTQHSEESFIRSMLVFKLWIQITKDVEERTKILKLASHLAKPPKELMEEPSKLAKDILPCNFRKCYIDVATYIIGTPWPLRKKTKIFLEHTRIVETRLTKECVSESSNTAERQKNEEMADVKALKEIQSGLQKIILLEKKNKQIIRTLKNSHYKYAPVDELIERGPLSLEYLKVSKKDASSQTLPEQNEEFSFSHSKVIHECMNEFFKRIVDHTNMETIQNQEREKIDLQHDKILAEISMPDLPNSIRNTEFPQESIPKEVTNLLNFDSSPAEKKKTIMLVPDLNANIQNNDVAVLEVNRKDNKYKTKKNIEDEIVSVISVKPATSISNRFDNVSSKAVADWHTPEVNCQSKVSSYNPFLPSFRMQMTSGLMNKGPTEINQTDPEFPSMTSLFPLSQETPSSMNDDQHNSYADLVRSTGSLSAAHNNLHHEPNVTNSSPRTLLNRRAIMRSGYVNHTAPGCREDKLLVRDTTIKYYPPLSKNNSNVGSSNEVQGLNSAGNLKDRNYPMQPPYPVLFNQYGTRPHYSHSNDSFSFYDDDTIANSGPRIMGTQSECPNLADPQSLVANIVRPPYPMPVNLPSGNNDEPTPRANQIRRRGRGSRNTSAAQRSYRKQSPDTPANIAVNTNPTSDNPAIQGWPNIATEDYNSVRTLDSNYIPNSSSQIMLRPPIPISNIIQNDPKLEYIRLPPYSSIRRKNNGFDPTFPVINSSSNSLPANTTPNCFPATIGPIPLPVATSQPFSPVINNSFSLPVINTQSSLPPSNVSLHGPVTTASTSFSIPRTSETNSDVMRLNNCYRTYANSPMLPPLTFYQKCLNIAFHKAIFVLTHKNDFGFMEYNFKKMPIPLHAFKDGLTSIEEHYSDTTETIENIVMLLSQTNKNFVNQKNMFPPLLLKVNNNDINKGKLNITQEHRKRHEFTLHNDQLAFVYQLKIQKFYFARNGLSKHGFMVKSDIQTRCYCLQCCVNRIVLDVNYTILKHFRQYQIYHSSVQSKVNEKNQPLKVAGTSKRSLEQSIAEIDSPLPLKKRITSTPPNEARSIKDNEVSYPSTPMISIAELELLKDISTNMMEHKTDSVNNITNSTSSTIPDRIVESLPSEISKDISINKPVSEAATYRIECNEPEIMPVNNNHNLLDVKTCQNLSNSELIQSSVAIQPSKLHVKSVSKKSPGRPRKKTKKDGQK